MPANLLATGSARTFSDIENDTRRSSPPLIGETTALILRQPGDERFRDERQRTRVLPGFEFLEVSHDAECRMTKCHSASDLCMQELFRASKSLRLVTTSPS